MKIEMVWKTIGAKAIAGVTGIALLAGWILTGNTGLSSTEKAVYEDALDLQAKVDEIGFPDFNLAEYPVAMYDGKQDYVFYQGKIEKRTPVLETFAGTAYPVEDHFEVIIPTLERFDSLLSLAGGVESLASGSGYGKEEQIATIWHEALHAWQLSNFEILGEKMTAGEMSKEMENIADDSGESEEDIIVRAVDKDVEVKEGIGQELHMLKRIVTGHAMSDGNIDEIKTAVLEYRELERQRQKKMPEEAVSAEQRCELTEGTAYYVEANILKMQNGEGEYEERYIRTLGDFEGGRGKYYRIGMAKCLILDKLSPDWKEKLDFTKSLDELLDEAVEVGNSGTKQQL